MQQSQHTHAMGSLRAANSGDTRRKRSLGEGVKQQPGAGRDRHVQNFYWEGGSVRKDAYFDMNVQAGGQEGRQTHDVLHFSRLDEWIRIHERKEDGRFECRR